MIWCQTAPWHFSIKDHRFIKFDKLMIVEHKLMVYDQISEGFHEQDHNSRTFGDLEVRINRKFVVKLWQSLTRYRRWHTIQMTVYKIDFVVFIFSSFVISPGGVKWPTYHHNQYITVSRFEWKWSLSTRVDVWMATYALDFFIWTYQIVFQRNRLQYVYLVLECSHFEFHWRWRQSVWQPRMQKHADDLKLELFSRLLLAYIVLSLTLFFTHFDHAARYDYELSYTGAVEAGTIRRFALGSCFYGSV